jgi:hypothetical protein
MGASVSSHPERRTLVTQESISIEEYRRSWAFTHGLLVLMPQTEGSESLVQLTAAVCLEPRPSGGYVTGTKATKGATAAGVLMLPTLPPHTDGPERLFRRNRVLMVLVNFEMERTT